MREHRIFGPPGTGKTTTLAAWIEKAYRQFGDAVLVTSFTRTAARELVGRDLPLPKERVGTLHSFCHRALGRPPIAECAKELIEWNEGHPPEERVNTKDKTVDDPMGLGAAQKDGATFAEYGRLRNRLVPRETWPDSVKDFATEWEAWKTELGALDFTDLIEEVHQAGLPSPFEAAVLFADEVQDCSPLELAVVRQWGEGCQHWVLAGDDDQAIYGFRGASPEAFLNPVLPAEQKTVLRQSYRLPETVRAYATAWCSRLSQREPKEFRARDEVGSVESFPGGYTSGEMVAQLAEAEAKAGRTVMLLGSCGFMLEPAIKILRQEGMPFHNPYRTNHGGWNPMRGGVERLRKFLRLVDGAYTWRDVWPWIEVLDWKISGFDTGTKRRIKAIYDDEEERHVKVSEADFRALTGIDLPPPDPRWFEERLLASKRKGFQFALRVLEERGPGALTETPKITVGTIHSVKGGQADTVLLFPDLSASAITEMGVQGKAGRDALIRLLYVGMTRPREKLLLAQGSSPRSVVLPDPA